MNFKIICSDRNNYEIPYNCKIFSGGEVQVKLGKLPVRFNRPSLPDNQIVIDGIIKNSDMFMEFIMLTDALHRAGNCSIAADLHYLPYARQDRVCAAGESFALSQFIRTLREIPVSEYIFDDLHSRVAVDLLIVNDLKFIERKQHMTLSEYLDSDNIDITLISPDKGASKKIEVLGKYTAQSVVYYNKVRNPHSGVIEKTELVKQEDTLFIEGKDCLIVDDICDGGRTFVPIVKDLINRGAKSVNLCVTHAILPYGLDALKEAGLNNFYYVNSFLDEDLPNMYHVSKLTELTKEK